MASEVSEKNIFVVLLKFYREKVGIVGHLQGREK